MCFAVVLFFAVVHFVSQLCHFFAVVLISCMIPTCNFAVVPFFAVVFCFAVVPFFSQLC